MYNAIIITIVLILTTILLSTLDWLTLFISMKLAKGDKLVSGKVFLSISMFIEKINTTLGKLFIIPIVLIVTEIIIK